MSDDLYEAEMTGLINEANALRMVNKDHQQYQTNIRKAIVDSGLAGDPIELDSLHLDEVVDELIEAIRRQIADKEEWKREAERNADSAARTEQGREALEVDVNNLRELNRHLACALGDIDNLLKDFGFHGKRVAEEHLLANAQRILFDTIEAINELKELRDKVKSLRELKIEPIPMVSAAWDALRAAGVNTVDHATLADAIGFLGQQFEATRASVREFQGMASDLSGTIGKSWLALGTHSFGFEANASLPEAVAKLSRELTKAQNEVGMVRSETHTEFVNGVLTVHTEGTTVIIVDRNA